MKVTLFMAMTANGMIARDDNKEDFLSDRNWTTFCQLAQQAGCFVIGRKTYEIVQSFYENYNFDDVKSARIVVSRMKKFQPVDGYLKASSPRDAINKAIEKGYKKLLLTGGSELNSSFFQENLIDEIIFNIKPAVLGKGISVFAEKYFYKRLVLKNTTSLQGHKGGHKEMTDQEKLALLEAMLFTTSDPMTFNELQKLLHTRKNELEALFKALQERYARPEYGIRLSDMGGYKLIVKPEFTEAVSSLTPHADLSRGLLRVLSIVAYHEPIKQSDIVKVVGNRTYDYVKELEERGLLKIEKKARTKMLSTTPRFEEYFGAKAEEIRKIGAKDPGQPEPDEKKEQKAEEKNQ
jgi:segregation and condensation protein B